jgi:hypothetical protein
MFDHLHPARGPEFQNKLERYWNNDDALRPAMPKEKPRLSGAFLE